MSSNLSTKAKQLLALALNSGSPNGEVLAVVSALRKLNDKGTLYTESRSGEDENSGIVSALSSDLAKSEAKIAILEVELASSLKALRMAEAQLEHVATRTEASKRRGSKRPDKVMKEVMELFERQSLQTSIDIIARKVDQPKAEVERAVARLVDDGWVTRINSTPHVCYRRSKCYVVQ